MSESRRVARSEPPEQRRVERRRLALRPVGIAIQGRASGQLGIVAVGLANISDEGLGVRLNTAVPVGEEVSLELFVPGIETPVKLDADVRWCEPSKDGTFRAGLRLHRRLTVRELTGLGE
jgi:hypothetical protein